MIASRPAPASLGDLIRERREAAGLTANELAARAGTAATVLRQYESGAKLPHGPTLARIAGALGVSADVFAATPARSPASDAKLFGRRLKAERERAGLTRVQLAWAAGIPRRAVTMLERGSRRPSWADAVALAKALGVSVAAFAEETVAVPEKKPKAKPRGKR